MDKLFQLSGCHHHITGSYHTQANGRTIYDFVQSMGEHLVPICEMYSNRNLCIDFQFRKKNATSIRGNLNVITLKIPHVLNK